MRKKKKKKKRDGAPKACAFLTAEDEEEEMRFSRRQRRLKAKCHCLCILTEAWGVVKSTACRQTAGLEPAPPIGCIVHNFYDALSFSSIHP